MVKVIDIDLERRRISLSPEAGQRGLPADAAEFDPTLYGMAGGVRRGRQLHQYPEGFDSETNEWLEGFDEAARPSGRPSYAEAERRHKMHTTQMEEFAAAEAAAAAERPSGTASSSSPAPRRPVARWPATPSWPPCARSWPVTPNHCCQVRLTPRIGISIPVRGVVCGGPMLRIGLTGGIGAGKSTVSRAFAECGGVVVDGDIISREVVQPGTEGLAALVEHFGDGILLSDGALNRPALAAIAFSDEDSDSGSTASCTRWLPAARSELIDAAAQDAVIVEDIPLLVESQMAPMFPLVVVVHADAEVRVERLIRVPRIQRGRRQGPHRRAGLRGAAAARGRRLARQRRQRG